MIKCIYCSSVTKSRKNFQRIRTSGIKTLLISESVQQTNSCNGGEEITTGESETTGNATRNFMEALFVIGVEEGEKSRVLC